MPNDLKVPIWTASSGNWPFTSGPWPEFSSNRAARKSQTLQKLYEALSAEVPEGAERKKFLANSRR